MTKDEALRLALEALESTGENDGYHGVDQYFDNVLVDKAITALRLAIDAQNMASKSTYKEQLETKDEPVCRLQEPTVERAWFTIAELNAWADKKLSENPHWVMPKDEPERDEPPPQRTWVGLTDEEIQECLQGLPTQTIDVYARRIEAKLKERNT